MTKILVVDDEANIREPLSMSLRKEGFEVIEAADGLIALEQFESQNPDLIVLDRMLPGMTGDKVCKTIRQTSNVPIIMLSAKSEEIDKVVGLEIGADDYVTKPHSAMELIARINAVLRRQVVPAMVPGHVLEAGSVRMDTERHIVTVRGEKVTLPLKEFELLEFLMENVNRVLTRGQIIDRVWGANYYGDTKTLDVHVKRIRSKIEDDPARPSQLITVRGLGYKFEV
jgi:two-component system response regulator RegX3